MSELLRVFAHSPCCLLHLPPPRKRTVAAREVDESEPASPATFAAASSVEKLPAAAATDATLTQSTGIWPGVTVEPGAPLMGAPLMCFPEICFLCLPKLNSRAEAAAGEWEQGEG